ncbi:MAG: NAD-dependent dehydratase [Deltaproteobacteria bacterium RIFCSPLOWO2_02_FULL_53_8]|nr:MAG: NAD-dependent dehydratase [Deltaproteobacteria bacterium RIFCSPLOWO2_02_FULL_53_8]
MTPHWQTAGSLQSVLVTGANGFIGAPLLTVLRESGRYLAKGVVRHPGYLDAESLVVPSIDGSTDWQLVIGGIDAVIHLAARVHVMKDHVADPMAEFLKVNVEGTLALARQAADAGVKRFVFLSSIKVNGEQTQTGQRYAPNDTPKPSDPYGISKCEAEKGLRRIAEETGMEVVIIRPVLVYGPGVKGNFLSMMRWLHKGIPLPLGAINNARSLVALDNLIDLIITCLHHPAAANQTFLVSDGEDISTTELLKRTASAMGAKTRLIPVPASIIQNGARLLGKRDIGQRLCGSLQVDISKTRELLGWAPLITTEQALEQTVKYFLQNQLR